MWFAFNLREEKNIQDLWLFLLCCVTNYGHTWDIGHVAGAGVNWSILSPCSQHGWAQTAMDRWIGTDSIDRYYWSYWPPIVSIHRLKIFSFWLIVSIIDHKILVKPMTIDPSVHFQPMVSIHRSEIDSPITIFLNEREPIKSILQQWAAVNTMF